MRYRWRMRTPIPVAAILLGGFLLPAVSAPPGHAQDIVGLEDCSRAQGADKKLGCLQSNVQYLHGLIRKTDAAAQARSREAAAQIAAANARTEQLAAEVARLKAALEKLEKKQPAK